MTSADLRELSASAGEQDAGEALDPRRRMALLHECRDLVVSQLTRFIAEALDRLSVELTITAMKAAGRDSQQALLDALSLVRVHRNDIEYRFRQAFAEIFERRLFDRGSAVPRKSEADATAGELSLVDHGAIDDRIAFERIVRRTRRQLDPDEVLGIRARLAALLDREWFDEDDYPASPEIVFEALQRSLDELEPPAGVREALLQAFEPHVTSSLAGVHASINERLRSQQVLPTIRPRAVLPSDLQRPGSSASSMSRANSPAATAPGAQSGATASGAGAGPRSGPSAFAEHDAASKRAGGAFGSSAATGMGMQAGVGAAGNDVQGYAASGHGAAGSRARGAGAAGSRAGSGSAGEGVGAPALRESASVGEGFDLFDDLVRQMSLDQPSARRSAARMLSDPDTFGMADLPMPTVEPPLIEALHALQSTPREVDDAAPLAIQLLDQARSKGSSLDQLTVEIVSLVFDYIYSDRRLPDPVKQQLLRLQVVAVKAALLDRSFFARRQHPMRRLIDRITDLATDPDADFGAESTLVDGVTGIVDWILDRFDDDLSTFDEAMARFDALAHAEGERRAARLLELTREAERLEALAIAQEEASAEIALRIDPVTPAFVREFLYKWWSLALAHARVEGLCADATWVQTLQSAEMLIWSVAPKTPDDIARLASLLPRMIGALMKSLKVVGIPDAERERFFNELLQWHTRAIQEAKAGAGRTMPAAASAIRIGDDGSARFEAPAAAAVPRKAPSIARSMENAEVDALRRGDVIEFTDDDGVEQTVKLAWISPTRKLYVLSRFPDFGRSLDRAALVSWFASGRARRADPHSAVDRAIDAIAESDVVAAN